MAGGLGSAGCNVLLDASDYAVGPGDGATVGHGGADDDSPAPAPESGVEAAVVGPEAGVDASHVAPEGGTPLGGDDGGGVAGDDSGGDDSGEIGYGGASIGDPCVFDSDCASNKCFGSSWCTAPCASATDTSCGYSTLGAQNYCEHIGATTGFQCYTGCGTSEDCGELTGTVCEPESSVSVCNVTAGAIGDPCESGPDSTYTACVAPDGGAGNCNPDGFCSRTCSTNAQCGASTSGNPNYCLQSGGSGPTVCVPGCAQDGDCEPFDDTFCLPVGGSATEFTCEASGGQIGDPCYSDDDCVFGYCGDQYACTTDCTGSHDTSCGFNSQNVANACAYSEYYEGYECFAGCTVDMDCAPYSAEPSSCTVVSGQYVCANSDATTLSVNIQLRRRHRTRRRH
jgi:hypothetical protein